METAKALTQGKSLWGVERRGEESGQAAVGQVGGGAVGLRNQKFAMASVWGWGWSHFL